MTIINDLHKKGLITPPKHVLHSSQYLCYMGSVAYGVSSDGSDNDVYGFCIPSKAEVFPHLGGYIQGFGEPPQKFEQWQEHHVDDKSSRKMWDFSVYSIVKFFHLCLGNNPNMINALFVPHNCILHCTAIGTKVRENRKLFLSKLAWHKFKGYAYSQIHKMKTKTPDMGSKRCESYEKYGYDVKFAYHCVRLLDEVDQILTTGDLDLQRSKEILKSIRRGEWPQEKVVEYFNDKEKQLEEVYAKSDLPWKPDEKAIKSLLIECLDMHFGSISDATHKTTDYQVAFDTIKAICDVYI